jgi:ankyrin repeat protein
LFVILAHTVLSIRVMDPQFRAAWCGDLQQLRVALTVNNVNVVDVSYQSTALHYAAQYAHLDCVKYCIEMGADVNARNRVGSTPLHCALERGSVATVTDCVKYCIEMGANVNASTNFGYTPLYYASLRGFVDVVRVLLDAGAHVDVAEENGRTPLCGAIRMEHVDVARLLMDRGARVSNVKLDGLVPAIPDWVTTFIESRSNCRSAAIAIIGIHKYRRTTMTGNNDINVLRLISKHIWSMRMDNVWEFLFTTYSFQFELQPWSNDQ